MVKPDAAISLFLVCLLPFCCCDVTLRQLIEESVYAGFEVSKGSHHSLSLSFYFAIVDVGSQLRCYASLSAAMLIVMMFMESIL